VGVLALGGLLGHAEHRADLGPRPMIAARSSHRFGQRLVKSVASLGKLRDQPKGIGIGNQQIGEDAYPDVWSKAASWLQSIVNDHALIDGNKRLGWLCTAVFLELNEVSVAGASNDDVYDLVIDVATNRSPVDDIAARLKKLSSPPRRT